MNKFSFFIFSTEITLHSKNNHKRLNKFNIIRRRKKHKNQLYISSVISEKQRELD